VDLPNVNIFKEQIRVFQDFLVNAAPDKQQAKNIDFLLSLGEIFTLVAYGQLIIEKYNIEKFEDDLLEQIFDFMVRDFSRYALQLYSKADTSENQMQWCTKMIRKPVSDHDRFLRFWEKYVYSLKDTYEMNP
jgi:acyl-CoA dehydrogenase